MNNKSPQAQRIDAVDISNRVDAGGENNCADGNDYQHQFERHWAALGNTNRRGFFTTVAASMGAAGLAACGKPPEEKIYPYVQAAEDVVPGKPTYYRSMFTRRGYAYGVSVESHQGRPTKVEGNPNHPATLGSSDVFMQAELRGLYDPDRSRALQSRGQIQSRGQLEKQLHDLSEQWRETGGEGLHLLTPPISSPSIAWQLDQLQSRYPRARWHQWQALTNDNVWGGLYRAFERELDCHYHLHNADVVVQLDGDILRDLPGSVRYARELAERRDPLNNMARLYAVESHWSLFGTLADHRLALDADGIANIALHLALWIGDALDISLPAAVRNNTLDLDNQQSQWLRACGDDLLANKMQGLVIAGENQPASVHAICHWLNTVLDNVNHTVSYCEPIFHRRQYQLESIKALTAALEAGEVDSLIMLDINPVYDAPADLNFSRALKQTNFSLHMGQYVDETAHQSTWHIPQRHALESWGDGRAYDGGVAIQQPLISPLFAAESPYSLLSFLSNGDWRRDYDCVRDYWRRQTSPEQFEQHWRASVIQGVMPDTQASTVTPTLSKTPLSPVPRVASRYSSPVLGFAAAPHIDDGRYANNAWLQELPQPVTTLTWGNALLVAPSLAAQLSVVDGDVVKLTGQDDAVEVPVCIVPGHAPGAMTLHLGYGATINAANDDASKETVGCNAYRLRRSSNLSFTRNVEVSKTGGQQLLAKTQQQDTMAGRDPVRHHSLDRFRQDPDFIRHDHGAHDPSVSLYPEPSPPPFSERGYQWALNIDLNACTGCGVCSLACQAENNIPVVGRDQVLLGREMHWLRVDRYFAAQDASEEKSSGDHPTAGWNNNSAPNILTLNQPMLCQHCENAPCEYVCPVGATVHDSEGLNVMIYNRCIGTRDCSQNCPYKVRRFNFIDYNYDVPHRDAMAPLQNPDVTVRSRGVMEKCTYCLQRISGARRQAKKENRSLADGEVRTACQQACPTQAITFGDISDPSSSISKARMHPLNYTVLAELNTRPRTTYLARIRNTNAQLSGQAETVNPNPNGEP